MYKSVSGKHLSTINFTIVGYFALLVGINFYKIEYVLLDVLREFLTLPFLIAQIVFLVISIIYGCKRKPSLTVLISIFMLAVSTLLTVGSFFM